MAADDPVPGVQRRRPVGTARQRRRPLNGNQLGPSTATVVVTPRGYDPALEPLDLPDDGTTPIVEAPGAFVTVAEVFKKVRNDDAALLGIVKAMRMQGIPQTKIALALSVHRDRVRRILRNARVSGEVNDVLLDLTHEALPLAVEKLLESLDQGKKWAIQQTLKGLGGFRSYRQQETVIDQHRSLEVTFVQPAIPVVMNPQAIVGQPRTTREVIDAVCLEGPTGVLPQSEGEGRRDLGEDGPGVGHRLERPEGPANPRGEEEGQGHTQAHGHDDDPLAAACR